MGLSPLCVNRTVTVKGKKVILKILYIQDRELTQKLKLGT